MIHTNNPIIKRKAGLLNLAAKRENVSIACNVQLHNSICPSFKSLD